MSDWRARGRAQLDEVAALLAADGVALAGRQVLDLTSGDGALDVALAEAGATVTGCVRDGDLDGARATLAERCGGAPPDGLELVLADEERLDAPRYAYDHVVSWEGFAALGRPVVVLGEAHGRLTRHGSLALRVSPMWGDADAHGGAPWRGEHYEVDEVQRLLLAAGFTLRRAEISGAAQVVDPELNRYALSRLLSVELRLVATATEPSSTLS